MTITHLLNQTCSIYRLTGKLLEDTAMAAAMSLTYQPVSDRSQVLLERVGGTAGACVTLIGTDADGTSFNTTYPLNEDNQHYTWESYDTIDYIVITGTVDGTMSVTELKDGQPIGRTWKEIATSVPCRKDHKSGGYKIPSKDNPQDIVFADDKWFMDHRTDVFPKDVIKFQDGTCHTIIDITDRYEISGPSHHMEIYTKWMPR